jgi:hypothetical protein
MSYAECGPIVAGRAHAAESHMSQPRTPEGVARTVVSKVEEFWP